MEKIMHNGVEIEPMDDGYGRTVYRVGRTQFGNLDAAKREIDAAKARPKVEWLQYRDFSCTKKTWPAGNITLHGFGREFNTFNDFCEFIDRKYGPDVVAEAAKLENIKTPDYLWTEVNRDEIKVTPAQMKMIKLLARDIIKHDGLGLEHMDGYEYKEFTLTAGHGGRLYLNTTVGSKKDEGTAAALICRTYRHMVIGPRGGLQDIGGGMKGRRARGYANVLIRGGRSR